MIFYKLPTAAFNDINKKNNIKLTTLIFHQATAHPTEETPTQQSIEDALKSAGDSISKAFQDAKPKFDELLAKGQEFFDSVGKKISEEAGKIIPKSDEKAA